MDKNLDRTNAQISTQGQLFYIIVSGQSSKANYIDFYHPPTKQGISSALYKLDPTLVAGPVFMSRYNSGIFFNNYHNEAAIYCPPAHPIESTVYAQVSSSETMYIPSTVIRIPQHGSNLYILQRHSAQEIF